MDEDSYDEDGFCRRNTTKRHLGPFLAVMKRENIYQVFNEKIIHGQKMILDMKNSATKEGIRMLVVVILFSGKERMLKKIRTLR